MNFDKQQQPQQNTGNVAKPFTPSLSSAFHRSNKSPLTPKLATPGGYRSPARFAPSDHPLSTLSKNESPAIGPNFLSANVTPRTGSRNSRRDVSQSSPTNTPCGLPQNSPRVSYAQPVATTPVPRTERSPVRVGGRLEPGRVSRAKTLATESRLTSRPHSAFETSESQMFFHASDARSANSADSDNRSKLSSSRPATFIYANGQQERQSLAEETNVIAPTVKRRSIGSCRPLPVGKPLSASPRLRSPKLNDSAARLSDSHSQVGSQVGSQIGSYIDDASETGSQRHGLPINHLPERPPPVPILRHIKSSSVDSTNYSISSLDGLRPSPIIISPISPPDPQIDSSGVTPETFPVLRPRIFSNDSAGSAETHASALQSPTKSEAPGLVTTDPAAQARIERKILDLEISNSSLLAINRTLEREMRKQHLELRRYRRLSRSGRLSVAPSARSISLTALSAASEWDEGSELSSVRTPDDLSDFSDEESVMDEGVMSPDTLAEHDARHRTQDEKRFFFDLAKHEQLLADSQKMNQSLKRCLGWTEELIKEGKKALEYNVHVNDVELGGRVLAPEEMAEIGESGRGLLSPVAQFTAEMSSETPEEPDPNSPNSISGMP